MRKIIIVEGPDGAGKTTLVRELRTTFNFVVGERAIADRNKLYTVTRHDTYTALGEAVKGLGRPRIWDRLFYSELVYSDIVGRPNEFSESEQSWVRRIIEALRCPVVVCMPAFHVVQHNALADSQMDGVIENLAVIYYRYSELLIDTFPEHTLVYDYTGKRKFGATLEEIHEEIEDYLQERRERTWSA